MYYIYAYIDPRTNLPFYIGKGKSGRKYDHLKETRETTNNIDKFRTIEDLIGLGLAPIITEIEFGIINESLAYNREEYYIILYGRAGIDSNGILTNKVLRGEPPRPIWGAERKQKHSEFNKSFWTEERRKAHGMLTKGNKGGGSTKGTVNVTDIGGRNHRIPVSEYRSMDKSGPIHTWKYVSTSSKESKIRRNTP